MFGLFILGKTQEIITVSKTEKTDEDKKLIEEWLKNNKVTICPPEETTPDDELVYKYKVGKRK